MYSLISVLIPSSDAPINDIDTYLKQRTQIEEKPESDPSKKLTEFKRPKNQNRKKINYNTSPMLPVGTRPTSGRPAEYYSLLKKRALLESEMVMDNNLRIKGPGYIKIIEPQEFLIIGPVEGGSMNGFGGKAKFKEKGGVKVIFEIDGISRNI